MNNYTFSLFDFSNAIKNPFAGQFDNGYEITIHHDSPDGGWDEVKYVIPEKIPLEIADEMGEYKCNNGDDI